MLFPVLSLAAASLAARGRPAVHPAGVPLLIGGFLLYRGAGRHRQRAGNTGSGFADLPERLVTDGPYALTRNPMYLGHFVFLTGLVMVTRSPVAVAAAVLQWRRFDARARADERRLEPLFGPQYTAYRGHVARWLPIPGGSG